MLAGMKVFHLVGMSDMERAGRRLEMCLQARMSASVLPGAERGARRERGQVECPLLLVGFALQHHARQFAHSTIYERR